MEQLQVLFAGIHAEKLSGNFELANLVSCFAQNSNCRLAEDLHHNTSETGMLSESAGGACKSVGSKAEPWNQWVALAVNWQ